MIKINTNNNSNISNAFQYDCKLSKEKNRALQKNKAYFITRKN